MKKILLLCLVLLTFIGSFATFASSQENVTLDIESNIQENQTFNLEINNASASTSLVVYLPENITYTPTSESTNDAFSVEENDDQLIITPTQENAMPTQINIPLSAAKSGDYNIAVESGADSSSIDFTVEPATEETAQTPETTVDEDDNDNDNDTDTSTPTSDASSVAENSSQLQLKAEQDGWTEQTTYQASTIEVDSSTTLYYQFGGKNLQGTTVSLDDTAYIAPGAYIYDKVANRAIYSLFGQDKNSMTSSNIDILIGAEPDSSSILSRRGSPSSQSNIHYYTKTDSNGLLAQKLSFDFTITQNSITYSFNMSIEMHGTTSGYVSVTETLTSLEDAKVEDITLGARADTKLDGNDYVPIKYIGQNEGLYIETDDEEYRLFYIFKRANSFPNWKGDTLSNSCIISSTPHNNAIHFQYPTSIGQETENAHSGNTSFYTANTDSSIYFKTQPFSLEANESRTSEFTITLQSSPPKMLGEIDNLEDDSIYYGDDLEFSGTWNDLNSDYVDLYYKIDDQDAVLFGDKVANPTRGHSIDWTQTISEEDILNGQAFTPGTKHTITFYAIDTEGYPSNLVTFNFTETYPTVTAKYVDTNGQTLAPDEVLTGAVGTDYQTTVKEIEGYALSSVDGEAQGTFAAKNTTVTYTYETIDYALTGQALAKQGDSYAEITTAAPGDTVRYSYTFNTPYGVKQGYYYDAATFTLNQIDENITDISNIQITDEAGNTVGSGTFSAADRTLTANLTTKDTERSEKLTLTFDAKISPTVEIGATIDQAATVNGSFTSGNTFSANSNTVHLDIVNGELKFSSAPNTISFGNHSIPNSETTYYGKADDDLTVTDARGTGGSWKLMLQLQTPLVGASSKDDLSAYLSYHQNGQVYPLSAEAAIEVADVQTKDASPVVISSNWAEGQDGFYLTLPGYRPRSDSYECTVNWTLQDTP
ncbi:MucBP domain-containing protein [Listeria costaricensis]|uniref:MucBP domain-containing protein n=1 Tax=Listeria costaricensis TaxID=2026604 RepID=UPI000C0821EA|nr:MucBP domain-containing protein [Listeria costaricensis]